MLTWTTFWDVFTPGSGYTSSKKVPTASTNASTKTSQMSKVCSLWTLATYVIAEFKPKKKSLASPCPWPAVDAGRTVRAISAAKPDEQPDRNEVKDKAKQAVTESADPQSEHVMAKHGFKTCMPVKEKRGDDTFKIAKIGGTNVHIESTGLFQPELSLKLDVGQFLKKFMPYPGRVQKQLHIGHLQNVMDHTSIQCQISQNKTVGCHVGEGSKTSPSRASVSFATLWSFGPRRPIRLVP